MLCENIVYMFTRYHIPYSVPYSSSFVYIRSIHNIFTFFVFLFACVYYWEDNLVEGLLVLRGSTRTTSTNSSPKIVVSPPPVLGATAVAESTIGQPVAKLFAKIVRLSMYVYVGRPPCMNAFMQHHGMGSQAPLSWWLYIKNEY